jgi:hypothetical protein
LEKLAGKTDWSATGTGRGGSAYNHRVSGLVQRIAFIRRLLKPESRRGGWGGG